MPYLHGQLSNIWSAQNNNVLTVVDSEGQLFKELLMHKGEEVEELSLKVGIRGRGWGVQII